MRRARHPIISPAPRGRRKSDLDQLRLLRRGGDRGPVLIFLARIVSFSTTSGREPGVRLPHPGIFSYLTTRRKGIRCSCSSLLWTRTTRGLDPPAPHRQHSGAFFILNDGSKGSSCFRSWGHEESLPRAPTLADAIASLMNSGAEQAWLLQMVVHNSGNGGVHGIRNVV